MTSDVVHDAIRDHLSEDMELGECFVTKWVAVVEVVGDDGRPWLVRLDSGSEDDPLPSWDASGLLYEALHRPENFDLDADGEE